MPFSDQRTDGWSLKPLPSLDGINTIQLDCETTGLHRFTDRPVGLALGYGDQAQYAPFGHRGGGPQHDEDTVKRWALRELRGKRIENLNTKFDIHLMESWGVPLREMGCTFHDVAHSEALLDDHEKRFNLNHLANKRLGHTKLDVGPGASIADQPAQEIAAYAERDVELVRLLSQHYAPLLWDEGLQRVALLEDAMIPVCVEMERNGVPLDMDRLTQWIDSSQALLERLQWDLYRMVGFTVNTDSPTDMARLWGLCKEPIHARTAAGRPSFTSDIVQDAATRHPAIQLAWRIGKLGDLRSKYFLKYREEEYHGRIHPQFNQMMTDDGGTISGRLSCVKPNMQTLMSASKHKRLYSWLQEYGEAYYIKDLCVPEHGAWVSADMRQQEFRLAVHYMQSARLDARYAADPLTNFHKVVEQMVLPYKPDIDPVRVKVVSFTSIYGGGAGSVAQSLGIDRDVAEEICEVYHQAFPEVRKLLRRVSDVANDRGFVKSVLGRRSRFLGQRGQRERVHKSTNAVIQSSAADISKVNLVAIYDARKTLGLTMRVSVHDSVEADIADVGMLPTYEALLNTQKVNVRIPMLWEVNHGPSWGQCK